MKPIDTEILFLNSGSGKPTEIDESSIENFWKLNDIKVQTEPMSTEISKLLIQLMLVPEISETDLEGDFIYNVIVKRCKVLSLGLSLKLRVFLSFLCRGIPGNSTIYLSYIKYRTSNSKSEVMLEDFCKDIFPNGFLTEDSLRDIWLAQKVEVKGSLRDNLFDYFYAYNSLNKFPNE